MIDFKKYIILINKYNFSDEDRKIIEELFSYIENIETDLIWTNRKFEKITNFIFDLYDLNIGKSLLFINNLDKLENLLLKIRMKINKNTIQKLKEI